MFPKCKENIKKTARETKQFPTFDVVENVSNEDSYIQSQTISKELRLLHTENTLNIIKPYRAKLKERFQAKKHEAKYANNLKDIRKLSQVIDKQNQVIASQLSIYTARNSSACVYKDALSIGQGEIIGHDPQNNIFKGNSSMVKYFYPKHILYQIQLFEKIFYWIPPQKSPPLASKIITSEQRSLLEEGLFLENFPLLSSSQKDILEQRLSNENLKWFNCEGNLKIIDTPLLYRTLKARWLDKDINKTDLTRYREPDTHRTELKDVIINEDYILEIQIQKVKFLHHHLFSIEHVLQNYLIMLCKNHNLKVEGKKTERIMKHLEALRYAKTNFQKYLTDENTCNGNVVQKIMEIIKEIRDTREKYFEEKSELRRLTISILEIWRLIKLVRIKNGYSSTQIKLLIRKVEQNYNDTKKHLDDQIEITCKELEFEFNFKRKFNTKLKSSTKEREPVEIFSKDKIILDEIANKIKECLGPPGEPVLHFRILYEQNALSENTDNKKENLRRNEVRSSRIFFKLSYGNVEICKIQPVPLSNDFMCYINETISIKTNKFSENVILEIYEQTNTLLKNKIGQVELVIPYPDEVGCINKNLETLFENKNIIKYKHTGVGSGNTFGSCLQDFNFSLNSDITDKILYTSGNVLYNVKWKIKNKTSKKCSLQYLKSFTTNSNKKSIELPIDYKEDPQDPVFSNFIGNLENKNTILGNQTSKAYFRQNCHLVSVTFCTAKEIEENIRYKFLQLRDKNVLEFNGLSVPNSEREMPKHLLSDYEKHTDNINIYCSLQMSNDINKTRVEGRKALRQIYFKIFQKCRNTEKNLLYDDVINEKCIRQIENTIRETLLDIWNRLFFFRPILNVKPTKVPSPKKDLLNEFSQKILSPLKLHVNVISAINIPRRIINRTNNQNNGDSSLEKEAPQFSVVAKYKNKYVSTSIVKGPEPLWNEILTLEAESLNIDYLNPDSLNGSFFVHLYEHFEDNETYNIKEEKIWIGSIEINISAISHSDKMEGYFQLQMPTVLFGYELSTNDKRDDLFSQTCPTCISLIITSQPKLPKLNPNMDELPTDEVPYVKDYIFKWNEMYNTNYPQRKFSALIIDINGKTSSVTRYIQTIELPQLNDEFSPDCYVKYFSMIPFTDYNKFYQNIWLNTQQLLKMKIGSVVDHAVASTCCLLTLNLEVWLLLGFGIPHGSSAYVLVKEYSKGSGLPRYYIYDMVTANKYYTTDKFCPLQRVYCLINQNNVWANIQNTDEIKNTRFDISKTSDWLPLFTNKLLLPSYSKQQKVIFSSSINIDEYENNLENKMRKKITKYRKLDGTKWNTSLSKSIKELIKRLDTISIYNPVGNEILQEIIKYQYLHNLKGFLISKPYTNSKQLFEFLENTGVLTYDGMKTQTIFFTHLVSYPNEVLNLWLLIATVC